MTTINESSLSAQQTTALILQKIFGEVTQTFDLNEGTALSSTNVRVIYLSSDIIHAIYDVLQYEAGEAWSLILKNCGNIWGKRVIASLENELQMTVSQKLGLLSVDSYITLLEGYFANHGWGRMRFYLDDASNNGIIRASLSNSLFASTLKHLNTPVDYMIAGMLQSIFSDISGHNLNCIQVSHSYSGGNTSEFVISGAARIARLEQLKIHDLKPNDVLEHLRAA
jgi:hypothetical protein